VRRYLSQIRHVFLSSLSFLLCQDSADFSPKSALSLFYACFFVYFANFSGYFGQYSSFLVDFTDCNRVEIAIQ